MEKLIAGKHTFTSYRVKFRAYLLSSFPLVNFKWITKLCHFVCIRYFNYPVAVLSPYTPIVTIHSTFCIIIQYVFVFFKTSGLKHALHKPDVKGVITISLVSCLSFVELLSRPWMTSYSYFLDRTGKTARQRWYHAIPCPKSRQPGTHDRLGQHAETRKCILAILWMESCIAMKKNFKPKNSWWKIGRKKKCAKDDEK